MYRMYGFWRSAAAFRVRAALNLKGLAFEETMVDLDAGEQALPAFTAINPAGAVPALFVDDGPPLTQSLAILDYLEDRHPAPPLLPADSRGRARVRALALIFSADHHPLIVPRVRRYLGETLGVDEAGQDRWMRHWLREGLLQGEARLAQDWDTGRFAHGDTPTIADLCLISQYLRAKVLDIPTDDLPFTERIAAEGMAIDAIARAAPSRQPGAPGPA